MIGGKGAGAIHTAYNFSTQLLGKKPGQQQKIGDENKAHMAMLRDGEGEGLNANEYMHKRLNKDRVKRSE